MNKQQQLIVLGNRRDFLTVTACTSPDVWEALGDEYQAIGAESNAAACYRRAEAYRNKTLVSWYVENSVTVP